MILRQVDQTDERIDNFIRGVFSVHSEEHQLVSSFREYCFVAEDDNGNIIGAITGHSLYSEVYISELVVDPGYRGTGLGSKLIGAVEEAFTGKGFDKLTVTTYEFQAPLFYQKLGFRVEYIREDKEPKLNKYFLVKELH